MCNKPSKSWVQSVIRQKYLFKKRVSLKTPCTLLFWRRGRGCPKDSFGEAIKARLLEMPRINKSNFWRNFKTLFI